CDRRRKGADALLHRRPLRPFVGAAHPLLLLPSDSGPAAHHDVGEDGRRVFHRVVHSQVWIQVQALSARLRLEQAVRRRVASHLYEVRSVGAAVVSADTTTRTSSDPDTTTSAIHSIMKRRSIDIFFSSPPFSPFLSALLSFPLLSSFLSSSPLFSHSSSPSKK
ncbi:MAG: hypothetical protein WC483_05565, partial [Candidatus Paceibacterota bacterium]